MASGYEVTCANKNQNGTIVRVGGAGWSLSCQEAIHRIIARQLRLYIFIGDEAFTIGIRGEGNNAYLALEPDGRALHTIVELPSC